MSMAGAGDSAGADRIFGNIVTANYFAVRGIGAGRMLAAWLVGIPALDLVTFGAAIVLFLSIGLVACYVPVRRATQIDAMEALRYE
jgi:ABC-type antimicrobial peptide transport system permease subunit